VPYRYSPEYFSWGSPDQTTAQTHPRLPQTFIYFVLHTTVLYCLIYCDSVSLQHIIYHLCNRSSSPSQLDQEYCSKYPILNSQSSILDILNPVAWRQLVLLLRNARYQTSTRSGAPVHEDEENNKLFTIWALGLAPISINILTCNLFLLLVYTDILRTLLLSLLLLCNCVACLLLQSRHPRTSPAG
jgi:hypothetical protein